MPPNESSKSQGPSKGEKLAWPPSKAVYEVGHEKTLAKVLELGLSTSPEKRVAIVGTSKDGTVGTDSATDSAIDRYRSIWRSLLAFCFHVGDYVSAIIHLPDDLRPGNPPPIHLDTAVATLRFFSMEKGTPLLHHRSNQPILDLYRKPIKCIGKWRSENTVDLYRTALTKLHNHFPTTSGPYQEKCDMCADLGIENCRKGEGCAQHPGRPVIMMQGNVGKLELFVVKHKGMKEYAQKHYSVRSTNAFLPQELRDIRTYLLSQNSLYSFMLWTVIIVGTKLFARVSEALEIDMDQIAIDYFVVTKDDVPGLCAILDGKNDNEPVHLMMWDDIQCPEFSPTRHLLVWIAISGINNGYLFAIVPVYGFGHTALWTVGKFVQATRWERP